MVNLLFRFYSIQGQKHWITNSLGKPRWQGLFILLWKVIIPFYCEQISTSFYHIILFYSYSLIVMLSYDTCLIKFKIVRVFVFFFEIKLIEQFFCRIFILKYPWLTLKGLVYFELNFVFVWSQFMSDYLTLEKSL